MESNNETSECMITCSRCGKKVASPIYLTSVDDQKLCSVCVKEVNRTENDSNNYTQTLEQKSYVEPIMALSTKYSSLRLLCTIYRIIAVLVAIVVFVIITHGSATEVTFAIFGGIIGVILLLAAAEIQYVFMDTEENTREIIRELKILNHNITRKAN